MLNLNGSLTKAGVELLHALERDFRGRAVPPEARPVAQGRPRHARSVACPRLRHGEGARARASAREGDRRRPQAPQGHHGRLRRRLHGHVQRHHPRRTPASARRLQGAPLAVGALLRPPRRFRDDEAARRLRLARKARHDLPLRQGPRDRPHRRADSSSSARCTSPPSGSPTTSAATRSASSISRA